MSPEFSSDEIVLIESLLKDRIERLSKNSDTDSRREVFMARNCLETINQKSYDTYNIES